MKYIISYSGFLEQVKREFDTRERAEQWCRQIGRKDLIPSILERCPICGRVDSNHLKDAKHNA